MSLSPYEQTLQAEEGLPVGPTNDINPGQQLSSWNSYMAEEWQGDTNSGSFRRPEGSIGLSSSPPKGQGHLLGWETLVGPFQGYRPNRLKPTRIDITDQGTCDIYLEKHDILRETKSHGPRFFERVPKQERQYLHSNIFFARRCDDPSVRRSQDIFLNRA